MPFLDPAARIERHTGNIKVAQADMMSAFRRFSYAPVLSTVLCDWRSFHLRAVPFHLDSLYHVTT